MKKFMKKIVSAALATTLAIGSMFTLASCSDDYTKDNTTIKIGVSGPLTGSAAKYGVAVKNSAQLAIDEINANGGLDGIMFELLAYDDEANPDNVNTTYSTMYESGMQISLGCVTSGAGLEFKELSKDDNVFVLTPSATADAIAEYDNAFQMCFADSNQGIAAAEYFNANYTGKKIGILYRSDDEYSTGIYAKFKETIDDSFKTALAEAAFVDGTSDFTTHAENLKDCDIVFMPIYYEPAAMFINKAKDVLKSDAVFYGCDGLDGIEGQFTNDELAAITQEISYLSHFNSKATTGDAYEFIEKYNAKYDENKEPVNQFGASAYDCVYAIYEALKTAKANGKEFDEKTSASDFCDMLKEVFTSDTFKFSGITGKSEITWSDSGFVNKEADKYIVND